MKFLTYILSMASAAYLGYQTEPDLRLKLTGKTPGVAATPSSGSPVEIMSSGGLKISLGDLTPDQLPQQVLLLKEATVSDPAAGLEMLIKSGQRVKLVSIDRDQIIISPGDGPFRGKVSIAETDLLQQIAANPPLPAPISSTSPVGESEEPITIPTPSPAPEPPPAPAPPPPVESAPATPAALNPADVVWLMQKSIKAGQINEFTYDQVLEWTAAPDETVDGESYQTGLASYKAETIFGVKTIQAKALIKGGTLQKWIWPKSGMEIK
jgi:hypothetical protein